MDHYKPALEEEPKKILPLPIDEHSVHNPEERTPQKQHQIAEIVQKDPHEALVTTALQSASVDQNQQVQDQVIKAQTPLHPHNDQIPQNAELPKENDNLEMRHHRISNESLANPLPNRQAVSPHLYGIPHHLDRLEENRVHPQWVEVPPLQHQNHMIPSDQYHRRHNRPLCPFWLKILIGLIVLSSICAILFWYHYRYRDHSTVQKQIVIQKNITAPRRTIEAIPENQIDTPSKMPKTMSPHIQTSAKEVKVAPLSHPKEAVKTSRYDAIIMVRGSKTDCPRDQLLINGNCLACEPGEEWFGLDCIPTQDHHRHMRRWH